MEKLQSFPNPIQLLQKINTWKTKVNRDFKEKQKLSLLLLNKIPKQKLTHVHSLKVWWIYSVAVYVQTKTLSLLVSMDEGTTHWEEVEGTYLWSAWDW